MKDKLSINIKIADRVYPLEINREEEEKYRLAAKILNDTVLKYRTRYVNHDTQDILAMAAFQNVLQFIELEKNSKDTSLLEEVKNINDDIADFLEEKVGKRL
jgi:cell division protein ZapA